MRKIILALLLSTSLFAMADRSHIVCLSVLNVCFDSEELRGSSESEAVDTCWHMYQTCKTMMRG